MELGSAIGTSTVQNRFHRTAHGHGHERSGIQHVLSNRRDPGRPGVSTAEAAAPEYPGHSVATQKYPTRRGQRKPRRNLGDLQLTQHHGESTGPPTDPAAPPRSRPHHASTRRAYLPRGSLLRHGLACLSRSHAGGPAPLLPLPLPAAPNPTHHPRAPPRGAPHPGFTKPVRAGSGLGRYQTGPNSKFKFEFKKNS